jgi:hypothetical protein
VYLDIKVWGADKVRSESLWGSISASIKDVALGKLDEYGNVSSWCTEERLMFDGFVTSKFIFITLCLITFYDTDGLLSTEKQKRRLKYTSISSYPSIPSMSFQSLRSKIMLWLKKKKKKRL